MLRSVRVWLFGGRYWKGKGKGEVDSQSRSVDHPKAGFVLRTCWHFVLVSFGQQQRVC